MNKTISIIILVIGMVYTSFATSPLPLDRTPGGRGSWNGLVGVRGGIPNRQTNNVVAWTNLTASMSQATANSIIASMPSNSLVTIDAGVFNWDLTIKRSGVTVRGAGKTNTILTGAVFVGDTTWFNELNNPVAANHRDWTGNYQQGTNVIYVTNTAGLSVGDIVILDQFNDTNTTGFSPVNPSGPYVNGEYSTVAHGFLGYDRFDFQINQISAISGTNITLAEPLYAPFWNVDGTNRPQLWFMTSVAKTQMSGVEDLKAMTAADDSGVIWLSYGVNLWVKNCTGFMSGIHNHCAYVWNYLGLRTEIRDSDFACTNIADRYGIRTTMSSGGLVENNTFTGHSTSFLVDGCSCFVYGYNYCTNNQGNSGFMAGTFFTHGAHPYMVLAEGNRMPEFQCDDQWQNSGYMTAFRNRLTGINDQHTENGNIQAVAAMYMHRFMSVIGNVLGTIGVNNTYQIDNAGGNCHGTDGRVYFLGQQYGGACDGTYPYLNSGTNRTDGYDGVVVSSLVRAVNWTSATSTNSGMTLDGFVISDLPNSYYLTNKPAWFGTLPYPPISPDQPTYSGSQTNLPAGWRFWFGSDPAAGGGGGGGGSPAPPFMYFSGRRVP